LQQAVFKFFGPYEILEKVGTVTYRLKLHAASAIHPVFHVSQLKAAPGSGHQVIYESPKTELPLQISLQILQKRMVTRGTTEVLQVLVHWSGFSKDLATWEDAASLKQQFPETPAWASRHSEGEMLPLLSRIREKWST
jgi:hypothetical protein